MMKFRESVLHRSVTFSHRRTITILDLNFRHYLVSRSVDGEYTLLYNAMFAVPVALPFRGLHSRVTNRIRTGAAALEVRIGRMTMFKVLRGRKFGSSRLSVLYLSVENSRLIALVCSLRFELLLRKLRKGPIMSLFLSSFFCLVCHATCNLLRRHKRNTSFEKNRRKSSIHSL